MANQIIGKVIAISKEETVASTKQGGDPFKKRSLYMDCTRHDPFTGERGRENTPLLEFGGKALEKLNALDLKKDDIVVVSFDIQGSKYTKDGKSGVFTRVRPYDIELYKKPENGANAAEPAPAPEQPANEDNGLPF